MKKLKAVVLGVGNRGTIYGDYANLEPEELEIVGLIDNNPFRLEEGAKKLHVSRNNLFLSVDAFLKRKMKVDFIINATMDSLHYETSLSLLKHGYNLLLEKPIVENEIKIRKLYEVMKKNKCKVCVCHVLRYTPFYSTIKELVEKGEIGEINTLRLDENVWKGHFVNSYVRGKWRNEKDCGSPLLLAKCCHDMDLICWLNNKTYPKYVSSFGARKMYTKENAPKGSSKYCYNCPVKKKCLYNAEIFELEKDFFPKYTWRFINKPYKEISRKEKLEYLKHDVMGMCVYKTDMDIVDRQSVNIIFDNGSIATFDVTGGTVKPDRTIHLKGTEGEILGSISDNKIYIRKLDFKSIEQKERVIDLVVKHSDGREKVDSHHGGDYGIMKNVCAYFRGDKVTSSLTKIEDSIYSHIICYAAEEARKQNKVIKIKKLII